MKRTDRGDSAVEKGFTLIEILIALALMSLVTTAIYSFYISQYKTWISQDLITEMQQNGRVAIDTISRDLLLTGYGTTVAIEEGTQNKIAVLYKDPTVASKFTRVMYWKNSDNELQRYEKSEATVAALQTTPINWTIGGTTLAEDVTSLEFAYFDKNGNMTVTPGSSPNEPYRVKVTIKLQTSRDDPLKPGTRKHFTLSTDIRPRNIGITGIASDTNPPAAPTGLQVVDPGLCGTLYVKWTPNTEADLASYTIYYGQATGVYTATVSVSKAGMDNNPVGESYPLTGLTRSKSNGTSTVTYYIKVVAVDTSGNASNINLSTEVGNDPNADPAVRSTNIRTFGAGNDTTVDIPKPSAPTGFTGVDIATENQVMLTWDASADPNVIGYRLYRRESAFGTFPVCATTLSPADCAGTQANTVRVADESIIGAGATSFLDKNVADSASDVATLLGCTTYYYALAPVTCDTTLIPDDGGDDVTKHYVASNYGLTYGDGPDESGPDSPANSDTAPRDDTGIGASDPAYPYPSLTARPGWKRASLTLTNPNLAADPDFSHTFIAFKRLRTDTVCTPLSVCYPSGIAADGTVIGGMLIPDKNITDGSAVIDGKFTQEGGGSGNNFFFDSESVQNPGTPTLENVCATGVDGDIPCTYYFTAVAFDRCGKPSQITAAAQPFSTLCGDDATALGSPGVPTGFTVKGCRDAMQLSWNDQSGIIDFAGYTVSSDTDSSLSGATILTNASDYPLAGVTNYPNPYWPDNADCPWGCGKPYYEDLGTAEGGVYYYFVRAMDCAYANDPLGDSNGDGNLIDFSSNISSEAVQGPVYPGMIDRDGGAVAVVTDHQEILTLDSRGDVTSDPTMGYHNRVKLYLRNTSAGIMTITGIPDIRWGNTSARLAKVLIGGLEYAGNNNTTTQRTVWQAGSAAQLLGTCTSTPSDLCTAAVTFSIPMEIGASDLHVPIIFEFRDAANAVNENVDMTGDSVFRMTLDVTNNSTNTTGCNTYLTTNREDAAIPVPTGPVMSGTVQNGTATDYPSSSTVQGYRYLGASLNVNVITNVSDTGAGISSVTLYYAVTERSVTSAPTSFAAYTPITMSLVSGQYKTSSPIPAHMDKRVWYYIIAKDTQGNFDRQPEIQSGFYTYDHQPGTPCSVTPKNPTVLGGTPDPIAETVSLAWTAATQYTSEEDKYSSDEFKYRVYRRDTFGGSWNQVAEVSSTNYTDSGLNLNANNYSYYVKTINKCVDTTPACTGYSPWPASPPKCLSTESNTFTECVGGGARAISPGVSSIKYPGGFGLTAFVCDLASNSTVDKISVHDKTVANDADDFCMVETGAETGEFRIDGSLYSGQTTITTGIAGCGPAMVCLGVNSLGDTITFDNIRYDSVNPTICSSSYTAYPATYATVSVTRNECLDTPATPANFVFSPVPDNSDKTKRVVGVTWTGNTDWDLAGYDVYSKKSTDAAWTTVCSVRCTPPSPCATNCASDPANTSDNGELKSAIYMWRIEALDSCSTANRSTPSAPITESVNP